MRLSVCMITRDELPFLKVSIPAARRIADQLIVVDSGSRDGSLEWLSDRVDILIRVPPRTVVEKGYSYLRNLAHKFADGDWIYQVDADEMISAEQADLIKPHLEETKAPGLSLKVLTFHRAPRVKPHEWTWIANNCDHEPGRHVRIYRNNAGIEWRGYIHEELWQGDTRLFDTAENTEFKHLHYTNYRTWGDPNDKDRKVSYMMLKAYNDPEYGKYMNPWWFQNWYPKNLDRLKVRAHEYELQRNRIDPY